MRFPASQSYQGLQSSCLNHGRRATVCVCVFVSFEITLWDSMSSSRCLSFFFNVIGHFYWCGSRCLSTCHLPAVPAPHWLPGNPHCCFLSLPSSTLQCSLPRRGELHADRQPGAEEAGVLVPDELCQESARHGHHGSQHLRKGLREHSLLRLPPSSLGGAPFSPLSLPLPTQAEGFFLQQRAPLPHSRRC